MVLRGYFPREAQIHAILLGLSSFPERKSASESCPEKWGFIHGRFELRSSVTLGKLLNLSVPHCPPHQAMALTVAMLLAC